MTKDTCLPQVETAQSLQSLHLQEIHRNARSLRITHSHAKWQCNKIINNTQLIANRNKNNTKLSYSSRRTRGYKERLKQT
jgi:hypothetical protein